MDKNAEVFYASTPQDFTEIVPHLLSRFLQRRKITLTGEIGAGKTTLVQAVGKVLGVRERIVSPTFSIVNEYSYPTLSGGEKLIHHLDLYRLRTEHEAIDMGIEEYLNSDHLCFIEWPQLVDALLPNGVLQLHLTVEEGNRRKLLIL